MSRVFEFRNWTPDLVTSATREVSELYAAYCKASKLMDPEQALFEMYVHQVFPIGIVLTVESQKYVVVCYMGSGRLLGLRRREQIARKSFHYDDRFGWVCHQIGAIQPIDFDDLLKSQCGGAHE